MPQPRDRATPSPPAHGEATLGLAVAVRPGEALGFRLAGAVVREIGPGEEPAAFRALLADPHLGVLAVEEGLLRAVPPRLVKRARDRGVPVVLPFALPRAWAETGRAGTYVSALIRRALGYVVKLGDGREGGAP